MGWGVVVVGSESFESASEGSNYFARLLAAGSHVAFCRHDVSNLRTMRAEEKGRTDVDRLDAED